MARPASRRTQARPEVPTRAALVDLALGMLVDHCVSARDGDARRFGPVVLVSPAPDAAAAAVWAVLAARDKDPGAAMATWTGRGLDADIAAALADDRLGRLVAAFAARRLVVVDGIDGVTSPERQQALVHLLDTSTAAGVAWCVSVAAYPPDGLLPQCGSRLGGGLVVPLPTPVAGGPAPAAGVSLARVIRAAARHHDLPPQAVVGPARNRTVAAARSLAMYLARTLTGRSFQAIGAACGGRDHTTVLHGVRVCAARIDRDPVFAADVGRLAAQLAGGPAAPRQASPRRRTSVGSTPLRQVLANRRRRRRRPA